ncbi:hypothetical protein D3C79_928780 [compost metagenome]
MIERKQGLGLPTGIAGGLMCQHFDLQCTEAIGTCVTAGWRKRMRHVGKAFAQSRVLAGFLQQGPDPSAQAVWLMPRLG